jgi:hypothetical protein
MKSGAAYNGLQGVRNNRVLKERSKENLKPNSSHPVQIISVDLMSEEGRRSYLPTQSYSDVFKDTVDSNFINKYLKP